MEKTTNELHSNYNRLPTSQQPLEEVVSIALLDEKN